MVDRESSLNSIRVGAKFAFILNSTFNWRFSFCEQFIVRYNQMVIIRTVGLRSFLLSHSLSAPATIIPVAGTSSSAAGVTIPTILKNFFVFYLSFALEVINRFVIQFWQKWVFSGLPPPTLGLLPSGSLKKKKTTYFNRIVDRSY